MRTVARLKMRLRNQRMLTRISEAVGVNMGMVRLCGMMSVLLAPPSSWVRMRNRSTLDMSAESCFRLLYDSIINAVTTAEKRPACQQI